VHVADVLDRAAVSGLVDEALAEFSRVDVVVQAAAVMAYGRIEDVPAEVFETVVNTAVHGTANVARAVLPAFRRQGHGVLVVVNSLVGEIAAPFMGSYAAGKWAQLALARALQLETRDAPAVHVCVVSPGAVNTPIYDQAANYPGRGTRPPPPVYSSDAVACDASNGPAATGRSAPATPSSSRDSASCPRCSTYWSDHSCAWAR
jgi:NAD(P)-dependent dehydrogenase (short-subunit alcohol dehydrogenase family)